MSAVGEAALAFVKLVGKIDVNITSFHDITDLDCILDTFIALFPKLNARTDRNARSMVRWLCINGPEYANMDIDVNQLMSCDPAAIEKVTTLMFYCKKESGDGFDELFEQMDDRFRKVFKEKVKTNIGEKKKLKHMRSVMESLTEAMRQMAETEGQLKVMSEITDRQTYVDSMMELEERRARENMETSQRSLEDSRDAIEKMKGGEFGGFKTSGVVLSDLQGKTATIESEIDEIKAAMAKLEGELAKVDILREKKSVSDMATFELQKELLQLERAKYVMRSTVEGLREKFDARCKTIDERVSALVQTKQSLQEQVAQNIITLRTEKQYGETNNKIQRIKELRIKRDALKRKMAELQDVITTRSVTT